MQGRIERFRLKLAAIEARSVMQRPENLINQRRQDCDQLGERALRSLQLMVERRRQKLASIAASLQALSPLQVLARGYSLTLTADGRVVQSADQVQPGDRIITRLNSGSLTSTVDA